LFPAEQAANPSLPSSDPSFLSVAGFVRVDWLDLCRKLAGFVRTNVASGGSPARYYSMLFSGFIYKIGKPT
jgi:hypothetical protein